MLNSTVYVPCNAACHAQVWRAAVGALPWHEGGWDVGCGMWGLETKPEDEKMNE